MKILLCLLAGSLVSVLVCAAAARSVSEEPSSANVDEFVSAELRAQHIPGLALAVVRDGKIVRAAGYGVANVELGVPTKPESIFQTGSVGKQFTATAVMMLVEEGKVGLDVKISKYFPGSPAAWKDIAVRHLLTHTSGIPDYTEEKTGGAINMRADYTEEELVKKIAALPLDFQPGEKWSYSNSGYLLLGVLIHHVTGEFYGDFLQRRVFQPVQMTSTRIISEADIVPNRCAGYRLVKGELKNQKWVSPSLNTTADGALYTNVLDLAKWDAALYTEKLLKKSSFDQMWTPVKLNNGKTSPYGFGWRIADVNGHRLLEHGGAWQGFTMHISRYVDDRFTIIVMTNLDSGHSDPAKIAEGVAALYVPALKKAETPDSK
ncbi:MAG TPA: serine hydrolase domain-containing protein [Candidatus Acidoferrum sp.]|nr:serine hydrolase domain-containing protein [Candidatus Acidoferrum sp.]